MINLNLVNKKNPKSKRAIKFNIPTQDDKLWGPKKRDKWAMESAITQARIMAKYGKKVSK